MGARISRWQGRKKDAALPEPARQWMPKFGSTLLKRHFAALTDDLNKAMQAVPKGKDDQQQLKLNLDRLFETATRLDPYRLSKEDARNLTDALYITLPRAVEEACSDAYETSDWDDVWDTYTWEFTSAQRAVSAVVRSQMDPDYLQGQLRPPAVEEEIEPEATTIVSFPRLRPLSAEIDGKVEELAKLWGAANALQVSVEDRYLLDQVAERYLPDTWQMIVSYKLLPDELREAADSMVTDQLQILTHQVGEIHQRAAGNSLDNLRTQTEFIRAQHEQRRGSKLTLDSEQD